MRPDLHAQIMNLQAGRVSETECGKSVDMAYKLGHRDARHAAAELALKADAVRDELLAALQSVLSGAVHYQLRKDEQCVLDAREAIAKATGEDL